MTEREGLSVPVRRAHPASGFTLVELLLAITIFALGSAMAVMITTSTMTSIRADGQTRRLISLMALGREMAITTRRDHHLRFDIPNNMVRLVRIETGAEVTIETLLLEYGVRLMQYPGMGDTPEGYGADAPVNFGNAQVYIFEPGGSFVDEAALPLNGTMFLGICKAVGPDGSCTHGEVAAARAVTVTGTTARARMYRWDHSDSAGGSWTLR